jgi:hypothetical protein
MNKPTNEVVALVVDHGLFLPWAQMLARGYKKVYYHTPWEKAFPNIADCVIGDGFSDIERCDDVFDVINEVDLFVFPDIGFGGLQTYLESIGKPVWGSKKGDKLEIYRETFMSALKEVGLSVPKYQTIRGLNNLKLFLKDKEDKYIKMSKYRGDFETFHFVSWRESEPEMDKLAVRFGALKDQLSFIVVDPIDTEIEDGYDGYCVDGKFPSLAFHGMECKDKGYICSVQDYDDLPDQIKEVNEKIAPKLAQAKYRNTFSTEVRITEDDFFFIDPTCRLGSPPSQVMAELASNWCDVIWHGAHGELLDVKPTAQFGVQTVITAKREAGHWLVVDIPQKIRQWVKCGMCCEVDERLAFVPNDGEEKIVGWVVGIGDSVQEAIDHLKENCQLLPDNVHTDTQSLVSLLQEMESAKDVGVVIADKVPEPASVLTN